MKIIDIVSVPYDHGRREALMGRGPAAILAAGLIDRLEGSGRRVSSRSIDADRADAGTDTQTTFALNRAISREVAKSVENDAFSIVLAGNCIASVGAVSGIAAAGGDPRIGILWMDAHGDFNTPETTTSGYLDGMALSILCGRAWKRLAAADPRFKPVPEERITLLGARDLDPAEIAELEASRIRLVSAESARRGGWDVPELDGKAGEGLYVHFDVDALDSSVGRMSRYASPGGLLPEDIVTILKKLAARFKIRGIGVTAYDPTYDTSGSIAAAIVDILSKGIEGSIE